MEKFSLWLETVEDGDKFIILDNGRVEIGDYDVHAEMPGYDKSVHVFHGYIFPSRKTIHITDFNSVGRNDQLRREVLKDASPYLKPGIDNMIRQRIITPQWTIKNMLNGRTFKVSDLEKLVPLSSKQATDAEKQWVADREEEGRKLAKTTKDPKTLFKNKERNPAAWFNRYEENTQIFSEAGHPQHMSQLGVVNPTHVTDTVRNLARQIVGDQEIEPNSSLMPILADALQDAGVTDEPFLQSLRDPDLIHLTRREGLIRTLSQLDFWNFPEAIKDRWDRHVRDYREQQLYEKDHKAVVGKNSTLPLGWGFAHKTMYLHIN